MCMCSNSISCQKMPISDPNLDLEIKYNRMVKSEHCFVQHKITHSVVGYYCHKHRKPLLDFIVVFTV